MGEYKGEEGRKYISMRYKAMEAMKVKSTHARNVQAPSGIVISPVLSMSKKWWADYDAFARILGRFLMGIHSYTPTNNRVGEWRHASEMGCKLTDFILLASDMDSHVKKEMVASFAGFGKLDHRQKQGLRSWEF